RGVTSGRHALTSPARGVFLERFSAAAILGIVGGTFAPRRPAGGPGKESTTMAQAVRAELLMIGTELLLGQTVDTNAAHIAEKLPEYRIHLNSKATVGDNWPRTTAVLPPPLTRADIVITGGGRGPTEDDLTREAAASV